MENSVELRRLNQKPIRYGVMFVYSSLEFRIQPVKSIKDLEFPIAASIYGE